MPDQPDQLETMLSELEGESSLRPGVPPPPLFIRAVVRRRRQRLAVRAVAACIAAAAVIALVLVSRPLLAPPASPAPGFSLDRTVARATMPDTSAIALSRANWGIAPEQLSLPEHPSAPASLPLRATDRLDQNAIDQWLGQ